MASPTGQAGQGQYPKTVIFMDTVVSDSLIRSEAAARGVSISEVVRDLIADGRKHRARERKAEKKARAEAGS